MHPYKSFHFQKLPPVAKKLYQQGSKKIDYNLSKSVATKFDCVIMAFDVVGANNLPLMYSVSRYCVYVRETNRKTRRDEIRDLKV